MRGGAVVGAFGLVCVLAACSSDESSSTPSSSCASDPLSCGAGKTCWVVDTSGKYDCIQAPTDKPADAPCQNTVGVAQCNAGLMCFPSLSGSANGSCQPFCAKDKTCANGGPCTAVTLVNAPNAPVVHACAPAGTGGTGGSAGAGGTTGGAGGATGGTAGASGGAGGAAGAAGGTADAGDGGPSDAGAD